MNATEGKMSYPEYYEILQVKPNASMAEIKRAYHALAKKLHPDLNKNNKKSEEQLKKVNEAYAVLKDVGKRAEYDYFGKQAQEAVQQNRVQDTAAETAYTSPREDTIESAVSPINKRRSFIGFFINKLILLLLFLAYSWLFYINTDKNEPYNIFKTLLNTSDYLMEKIPEKTKAGIEQLNKWYCGSMLPEKLTFYLVKKGDVKLMKMFSAGLDTAALDSSNNMHSLLMSSPNGKMTEYLLTLPHEINYVAKDDETALSMAVKRNDVESVELLLQNGADVRQDKFIRLFKQIENKEIKELLLRNSVKKENTFHKK